MRPRRGRELPGFADEDEAVVGVDAGARRGAGVGIGLEGMGIVFDRCWVWVVSQIRSKRGG